MFSKLNMIDEFETWDYPPGTMFAYWFEGLMAESGWNSLNWETQEVSRCYWDRWHERKRKQYKKEVNS